jgi:hypothetical protein
METCSSFHSYYRFLHVQQKYVCRRLSQRWLRSVLYSEITPCSPAKVDRYFGGTCHLHLQGRRISRAFSTGFHAGFLLGLRRGHTEETGNRIATCFRELLSAWVEYMELNGPAQTEETATATQLPHFTLLHSVPRVQLSLITILANCGCVATASFLLHPLKLTFNALHSIHSRRQNSSNKFLDNFLLYLLMNYFTTC